MENKRFKPLFDKFFFAIWIPTSLLMIAATVLTLFEPIALAIIIVTDLFTLYFMLTSTVGYVELRKDTVYIKFGFIIKREIPYKKIRAIEKTRKLYSDSMLSLKNAMEHVNIRYNSFDIASVSVVGNDELMSELQLRIDSIS